MLTDADRARLDAELRALAARRPRMTLPHLLPGTLAGLTAADARDVRHAAAGRVEAARETEYAEALAVARAAGADAEWAATVLLARAYPEDYRVAVVAERDRRAGGAS